MTFDDQNYTVEELTVCGQLLRFRAFRGISYVERPVDPQFQQLNLFVPEGYYEGRSYNGYTLQTAPVFVPNRVGGYRPGVSDQPGPDRHAPDRPNPVFRALAHGCVVAAPALRGRGRPGGKAPACIVDYKAAIRWLHFFADVLPGDESKIITNGTSAGGALSALMGATGDHPDYAPYLEAVGAAEASDAVFAASCYCPITNLDHADAAYEWQFQGVNTFHRKHMSPKEGDRPSFTSEDGQLTEQQIRVSKEEAGLFPAYVNGLELLDAAGRPLTLGTDGEGTFKEYVKKQVLTSAQAALDKGADLSQKRWLTVENGRVSDMDFYAYVQDITRMKTPPAFDGLELAGPENELFGTDEIPCRHFTAYSRSNSLKGGDMADAGIIKLLNPMAYLEDSQAVKARHWRIRHGVCDRDTSLAVSAILTVKLQNIGCTVDYALPWDTPHSGDYDLDELFTWIDRLCKSSG